MFGLELINKFTYVHCNDSSKYYMERHTGTHKVPYFVKKTFEQDFSGNIIHLESQVEEEYINNLRFRCFREKDYSKFLSSVDRLFVTSI